MSEKIVQQNDQKPILPYSFLQFTESGAKVFTKMVDAVRKHGTLEEACVALDFMRVVESNHLSIEKQQKEMEQDNSEETPLEGEVV